MLIQDIRKPAFCETSRLASSSGDNIYAPVVCLNIQPPIMRMAVTLTFGNGYNISEWYTGINLYLVEGIIVTLKVIVRSDTTWCQKL